MTPWTKLTTISLLRVVPRTGVTKSNRETGLMTRWAVRPGGEMVTAGDGSDMYELRIPALP